ncbi:MAG: S41 family peptidase [Chthoniobacterales bacterium]
MKFFYPLLFLTLLTLHPLLAQTAAQEVPPKAAESPVQRNGLRPTSNSSEPIAVEPVPEQKEIPSQEPPAPEPTNEPSAPELPQSLNARIDLLSTKQLDLAIELLQKNFVNPSALQEQKLLQARLNGLLERLDSGADIVPSESTHKTDKPHDFLAEVLDGRVGYVRIGSMDSNELVQMDAVIKSLDEQKIHGLILDLRSIPYSTNFEMATEFARRFCGKGHVLFRVEKPNDKQERIYTSDRDPIFDGTLVILINERTSGAAEVLAATLRQYANAMIIGAQSAGEAVEFDYFPLGPGVDLEVAVAIAGIPGSSAVFPDGVSPDIALPFDADQLDKIFSLSKEQGVSSFVFEKSGPRFNEAALIADINPEIQADKESQTNQPLDIVLQRAVDLITAIEFFNTKGPTDQ